MPARITVRAELQSLLSKSQELTDANRLSQLRKEADRREDLKRLAAKKAKEEATRKKPLQDPVGRNIRTAAMGQQGNPVAVGYEVGDDLYAQNGAGPIAIGAPGFPTLPGDSTVITSEQLPDEPEIPRTLVSPPYGWRAEAIYDSLFVSGTRYGGPPGFEVTISVTTQTQHKSSFESDSFVLPVNRDTLIYCKWVRTKTNSSSIVSTSAGGDVWTKTGTEIDGSTVYSLIDIRPYDDSISTVTNGTPSAASVFTFCCVIGKQSARVIPMPAALRTAIEARNPGTTWQATTSSVWGSFVSVGSPQPVGSDALSIRRFELGGGVAAGVFEALGAASVTPPSFALGACQLSGTCEADRYGFDLTRNPDATTPTYQRNRAGDIVIPSGRTTAQLRAAWDWGRARYCREQLLALGFAPEDLTP
jgi:hypothetical protein